MKQRSGMPYDVVAYEADEKAKLLTLEEEGLFHRLLRHAWQNGSIPDDISKLAPICRAHIHRVRKCWKAVSELWVTDPVTPHRLVNMKQESERLWISKKKQLAKDAAAKRWKNKRKTHADALPTQSGRNASLPSPPLPIPTEESNPINDSLNIEGYGEFHRAILTKEQYDKLQFKLNGKLGDYIDRFDRWVNDAPNAKHAGVQRKDRHAYESILAWHDKDQQQVQKAQVHKETYDERVERKNRATAAKLGIDYDDAIRGGTSTNPVRRKD